VKVPGPIHLAYAAAVLRRRLGRNGPEVSLLGLGCNNFGQRVGLAETRDIVAAALDEGVTFFDTADLQGRRSVPARRDRSR
jgi:aryl-alcohol dehydrogenase-like predicted oxidoreductase